MTTITHIPKPKNFTEAFEKFMESKTSNLYKNSDGEYVLKQHLTEEEKCRVNIDTNEKNG